MRRNEGPRGSDGPGRKMRSTAVALVLFALGVYGVLHSLGGAFDATLERERRATALAALASPPRDAEGLSSWMGRLEESAPPFLVMPAQAGIPQRRDTRPQPPPG